MSQPRYNPRTQHDDRYYRIKDSFRDLTRIARINDKMWAELFLWNKDNLISEIDMFSDALATMRQKLVDDYREGLEKMFRLSTERRKAFDKK